MAIHRHLLRPLLASRPRSGRRTGRGSPQAFPPFARFQNLFGNRATRRLIQAKLEIAPPGDRFEREADRMAEDVLRSQPAPQRPGRSQIQRQPQREAGAPRATVPDGLMAGLGSGYPLPAAARRLFEPRFGHDFGRVRLHTGVRAAEAAQEIDARAFTLGRHIVFAARRYAPQTPAGRRLLAHELTHVVQQGRGLVPPIIQRDYPWKEVVKKRELDPQAIPSTLNYELIQHKLIAHTTAEADIGQVVELIETLNLYYGIAVDKADLTSKLKDQRAKATPGKRVSIDVTPFLPASLQKYMTGMESYYAAYRAHMAVKAKTPNAVDQGLYPTPDDIFQAYEAKVRQAKTPQAKEALRKKQIDVVRDWYKGMPSIPEESAAACHNFLMLAIGGSRHGTKPGRYAGKPYAGALRTDLDQVRLALASSLAGKGPYRKVSRRDVKVGDIAVFRAAKPKPMLPNRIIHSAIVIRVSGRTIELLEKTNPHDPMATRTVDQVLARYRKEGATVAFLAPALEGLPAVSPRHLGKKPPSEPFTVATGKGPEDTHVLFKADTDVLRPHEDRKLFSLIAAAKGAETLTVHGYASEEGEAQYNLNLSAHRAVSVKKALDRHLPKGSQIDAVARGETSAFGPRPQNRRAGIERKKKSSTRFPLPRSRPGLLIEPRLRLDLPSLHPDFRIGPGGPRNKLLFFPPEPFLQLPDYPALVKPFLLRGVPVSARELEVIVSNRQRAYDFFLGAGAPPQLAATLADTATSFAYDRQLSLQHPTKSEELERKGIFPKSTGFSLDVFEVIRFFRKK